MKLTIFSTAVLLLSLVGWPLFANVLKIDGKRYIPLDTRSKIITKAILTEVGVPYREPTPPAEKPADPQAAKPDQAKYGEKKAAKGRAKKATPDTRKKTKGSKEPPFFEGSGNDSLPKGEPEEFFSSDGDFFGEEGKKRDSEALDEYRRTRAEWEAEYRSAKKRWGREYRDTVREWEREKREFLKRLPIYQNNLVDVKIIGRKLAEGGTPASDSETAKQPLRDYHLLPGILEIPVRDQGRRGTCGAFAAVRAMEGVFIQHRLRADLSEQFFYWSSRPDCQKSACSRGGSWFGSGLVASRQAHSLDIPLESDCPYSPSTLADNDTQTPLPLSCFRGAGKAVRFRQIKAERIVDSLHDNAPVLGALKLTQNFYKTPGLVTWQDAQKKPLIATKHRGHAVLIVGYAKLPAEKRPQEGEICYLAANSWGRGWGKGGYACLTQRWLEKQGLSFIALSRVEYRKP